MAKPAEAIVREMVCDLLAEAEQGVTSELLAPTACNDSCCEVASLIKQHLPNKITTGFSLRRSRMEIMQLRCVEQRASGYCGHYALFFTLEILGACCATTAEEVCSHIAHTGSPVYFWKRYWRSMDELVSEACLDGEEWWPWTRMHIHSGDMERSFLNHLLSTDTQVLAINTNDNIHILHYAYGLIQNSTEEICAIQKRILELDQSREDRLAFILGVTNHWVTLVVEKTSESGLHAFYLDSNNEPVLMATESELRRLVEAREEKHVKRKGAPYSDWKRNVLYQSFVDQRDIVELLVGCVSRETDLRGELTKQNWSKLLDSFYECVSVRDGENDLYLASLVQWIEQYYPTKVILDHHTQLLERFQHLLDEATSLRLQQWIDNCEQYSTDKPTGVEFVESFYFIVDKIKKILKNNK